MSTILLVTSSPRAEVSYSNKVARSLVDELAAARPGARIVVRDLVHEPLPHIGADFIGGLGIPAQSRTGAQKAAVALSDELIEELFAAALAKVSTVRGGTTFAI